MSPDDAFVAATAGETVANATASHHAWVVERGARVARHPLVFVAACTTAGAVLGVIARVWMRWISVDPEFSWSGTLAIVTGFTVFAAAQAATAVVRIRSSRPAGIAAMRLAAAVLSGGLFGAAGAVMLPTVVFGSIATWRTGLRRVVRVVIGVLALPSVVFVVMGVADDHGWSLETIAQVMVFVSIYAAVVAATWPTVAPVDEGWRPPRLAVIIVVGTIVAFLGTALYFGGIE